MWDLSQKEMAGRLGMTQQNLSFLEQKETWPEDLLLKVSETLDIPLSGLDYLASETDLLGSIIQHNTQGDEGNIGHNNTNSNCYNSTYNIGNSDNAEELLAKIEGLISKLGENAESLKKAMTKKPKA
jgi:transcriptional regulator with XRE-family HTH domain